MATEYSVYVRHEVYLRLGKVPVRQRSRLLSFFDSLERDPFQHGDYEVISPEDRQIQVKIIGSYALLFWADHPVSEIKVVDLVPADT
jgi:hypothetical protein